MLAEARADVESAPERPTPATLDLAGIQRLLDRDTVLIEYSLGERRSYVWAVTPDAMTVRELPDRARLETAAREVHRLVTESTRRVVRAPMQRAVNELGALLLKPIARDVAGKRLVIVADGALQYVPFATLPDPDRASTDPLMVRYEIVMLPSASTLELLRQSPPDRPIARKAVAVFADPVLEPTDNRFTAPAPTTPSPTTSMTTTARAASPTAAAPTVASTAAPSTAAAPTAAASTTAAKMTADSPTVASTAAAASTTATSATAASTASTSTTAASTTATTTAAASTTGSTATTTMPAAARLRDLTRAAEGVGVDRFERLPYTRDEAMVIASKAGAGASMTALGFEATRELALSPALADYRIVHFATHTALDAHHPERSGIVLTLVDRERRAVDGFLRLHDIFTLRLGADLVVLSACQTALGKDVRGEGLIGLTRGFMHAGASQIVASLWNIRDRATARLMARFYAGLLERGLSPAAALREAQVSMWKTPEWRMPAYWAGFVVQGDWRDRARAPDDDPTTTRTSSSRASAPTPASAPPREVVPAAKSTSAPAAASAAPREVALTPVVESLPAAGGQARFRGPKAELTPTVVTTSPLRAGSRVRLAVKVRLPEKIHVQSNKPREAAFIPTVLTVEAPAGLQVDKIGYPPASDLKQEGLDQPLAVFGREFTITVEAKLAKDVRAGEIDVPARLRYQACDELVCYPPANVDTRWRLRVSK